jgi:hypothetical protein
MFGLNIGDIINTLNHDGKYKSFKISLFETDKYGNTWAIMGNSKFLENFGYYGERMWLVAIDGISCWEQSKWIKIK